MVKIQINPENHLLKLNKKKKIIISIIVFSFCVFLFLSFNSYWVNWKVDQIISPNSEAKNILGPVGIYFAKKLIGTFGLSAYGIIILLLGICVKLISRIQFNYLNFSTNICLLMLWSMLFFSFLFKGLYS